MITERLFDEIRTIPIVEVTLRNSAGMQLSVLNYGATIRNVVIPAASGKNVDVCLGYDSVAEYAENGGHFGGSIGRFANRISGAAFDLDGKHYTLAVNDPPNHLHGGLNPWDKKIWDYKTNEQENSVTFTCKSADMEEGYPGEVHASAKFTLYEDLRFSIEYTAVTDKATPVNMTNHWYFNLNGHYKGQILDHSLKLNTGEYSEIKAGLIPTGKICSVEGTPLDFREEKTIRQDFDKVLATETQGYDHNFVLGNPGEMKTFAVLHGDLSGITMTASTNMEAFQLYTGNHISERKGKEKSTYSNYSGMCMEPHHFPDAVNRPEFPSAILRPGETYYHHTEFSFEA